MASESPCSGGAKKEIRARARAERRAQQDKDGLSRRIAARFVALPQYKGAETVLFYVDFQDEARTRPTIAAALAEGKGVGVPFCEEGRLRLFRLLDLAELAPGTLGILEPRVELRNRGDRQLALDELGLVMVPGLAFDPRGGRLGHGKGYYDKLLATAAPGLPLVAVAYECQVFPEVPMLPHDIFVDKVVTERTVYQGDSRQDRVLPRQD